MVNIQIGDTQYEWIENWAKVPLTGDAARGWAHPGRAVTAFGEIVTCHPARAEILFFDSSGVLKNAWSSEFAEVHGITTVHEASGDYLWLADNGSKSDPNRNYFEPETNIHGRVVKMTPDGDIRATLPEPPLDVYREGSYAPTSVVVFEESKGGNGDIWVADGYGANLVHRFDRDGNYTSSLDGQAGTAGAFATPHALYISTRSRDPELYIADRRNSRIQVYDLDGNFKRVFGQEFLMRPGGFAPLGDLLVIAELTARLAVIDANDRFVTYVGNDEIACEREGWPNRISSDGQQVAPQLVPGKFNSPHAIASDAQGNLYITEWVIGGRTIKLARR
jgi:hypothetical protein